MRRMSIEKAIKKQKNRNRNIIAILMLLFLILPAAVLITGQTKFQFVIVLIVMEMLILLAVFAEINIHTLKFTCHNNRLRIQQGIINDQNLILYDTIKIVHAVERQGEIDIIIITNKKVRNKYMKSVNSKFFDRYSEVYDEYKKLKRLMPDENFYRTIIRAGGMKKYILLKEIYSACVKAVYTESAIESIKIARAYKEIEY